MEIFRDIKGYEGLYQVSNKGIVKSLDRVVYNNGGYDLRKGKLLKLDENRGYLQVHLCKNGKSKTFKVHQLVAYSFPEICGEYFTGCEINHIDGVKTNNTVENLEVCTKSENMRNPVTVEKLRHTKNKPVLQYDINGNFIKEWESISVASNELHISRSTITDSINGRNTRKYKWVLKGFEICA